MDCIDELNYFQKKIFIEFYNKLFKYRNETVNIIFKYNETTLLSEFEFIQTFKCFYSFLDFNENSIIHNEYEYFILTRDMKFKNEDIKNFHFLALPFRRDLKTVRDLN